MTRVVKRWWPIGPGDGRRASSALATIVDAWMTRWVASAIPLEVRADTVEEGVPATKSGLRWHSTSGVDLSIRERAWDRVVRAALDLPDHQPMPFEGVAADVVDSLSSAMRDDLIARITEGLKAPDLAPARTTQREDRSALVDVRVVLFGDELLLHVSLGESWLRDVLPPAVSITPSPASGRRAAMNETRASLTAVLGSCEISAAELTSLSVGDVLATNTPVDQPIELVVHGHGGTTTRLGRAAPVRSGNRIALVVSTIDDTPSQGAPK